MNKGKHFSIKWHECELSEMAKKEPFANINTVNLFHKKE